MDYIEVDSTYDSDESGSSDAGIRKKCFSVEIPEDFDPSQPPTNGEEYLHHVMYEARGCKQWCTANVERVEISTHGCIVETCQDLVKAPKSMLPTREWQKEKLADFIDLRKYLEIKLKDVNSRTGLHDDNAIQKLILKEPTFSEISRYCQAAKIAILQVILGNLNKLTHGTFNDITGMWIYSILATLEIPLCPSFHFCLRELARKCAQIRSKLPENSDSETYLPLNLFICIVANYFKQFDLSDIMD